MANNIDRGGGSAVAGWMPGTYTTYTDPTDRMGQLDPYSSNGYITTPDTINAAGNLPAWGSADAPMSTYILNEILKARTPATARTNPAYLSRPDDNGNMMIQQKFIPTQNINAGLSQAFADGLTGAVEPGLRVERKMIPANDMQARANAKRNYETRRKDEE